MSRLEILFLGSCACNYSRYAHRFEEDLRDRFDFDARRASCLLVNGHILIDCGPHCLDALRIAGVSASDVTDLLLTHLHGDHFCPENVEALAKGRGEPLRVWVSETASLPPIHNAEILPMRKFQPYAVSNGVTVTAVSANHDPETAPQHLLLEKDGGRMLYACDGAWFMTETYNYLKKKPLDLLILDATCGEGEGEYRIAEHNTLPMIRLMLPSLRTVGIIDDRTQIVLTHIAPSLHRPHRETEALVAQMGCKLAYDGLRLSADTRKETL